MNRYKESEQTASIKYRLAKGRYNKLYNTNAGRRILYERALKEKKKGRGRPIVIVKTQCAVCKADVYDYPSRNRKVCESFKCRQKVKVGSCKGLCSRCGKKLKYPLLVLGHERSFRNNRIHVLCADPDYKEQLLKELKADAASSKT